MAKARGGRKAKVEADDAALSSLDVMRGRRVGWRAGAKEDAAGGVSRGCDVKVSEEEVDRIGRGFRAAGQVGR